MAQRRNVSLRSHYLDSMNVNFRKRRRGSLHSTVLTVKCCQVMNLKYLSAVGIPSTLFWQVDQEMVVLEYGLSLKTPCRIHLAPYFLTIKEERIRMSPL
jgi:hypothetical protein